MIAKTTRYGMLAVLFSIMGAIELWLWYVGHANPYALYIGLVLMAGAVFGLVMYISHRKKV